jgi:DNA-binding beta-propeller fold protein YncE
MMNGVARVTTACCRILMIVIPIILIAGCAEKGPKRRYFWPPPPDEPKVEWLGAYASQLDLPSTPFRRVREFLTGQDTPIFFKKPIDIRSNGSGKVYILDQGTLRIYIYDFNENEVRALDTAIGGEGMINASGIAVAKDGSIYVLDNVEKKVFIYSNGEKLIGEMAVPGDSKRLVTISYDRLRDRLLVCDIGLNQIVAMDRKGNRLFTIGRPGSRDGEFSYPVSVAVAPNGDLVVADVMNARIQIFDSNGNYIRKFGRRGDGVSDFQIIKGVAVDSDYNIYVTEGRTSRVLVFSEHGEFLLSLGGEYFTATTGKVIPGGFMLPQGIDIDRNDTIYVVDQLNQRFQVFQYLKGKK